MGTKVNTDRRVLEAITAWHGNVQAASDELGVAPKNLRARLRTLKVDLQALRTVPSVPVRIGTVRPGAVRDTKVTTTGSKNAADTYRGNGAAITLVPTMQTAAAEAEHLPIPTSPRRAVPTRLKPEQQDRLKAAKFDLQAAYRVETDENALLQQFFDETFDAWVEGKLSEKPGRKRKGGAE